MTQQTPASHTTMRDKSHDTYAGVKLLAALCSLSAAGCSGADRSPTYTLYRNSPLDAYMRVHVATYDADDRGDFNQGNCDHASRLLNAQGVVGQRWWCEAGRFRK